MWQAVGSDIGQANEMTGELRCKTPQQKLERNQLPLYVHALISHLILKNERFLPSLYGNNT